MKKNSKLEIFFYLASSSLIIYKILKIITFGFLTKFLPLEGLSSYALSYSLLLILISLVSLPIALASLKIASSYHLVADYSTRDFCLNLSKKIINIFSSLLSILLIILAGLISKEAAPLIRITAIVFLLLSLVLTYYLSFLSKREEKNIRVFELKTNLINFVLFLLAAFLSYNLKFNAKQTAGVLISVYFFSSIFQLILLKLKTGIQTEKKKTKLAALEFLKKLKEEAFPIALILFAKLIFTLGDTFFLGDLLKQYNYSSVVLHELRFLNGFWAFELVEIITIISLYVISNRVNKIPLLIQKKSNRELEKNINQNISQLLYKVIPIASLLSFLSLPIFKTFLPGISNFNFFSMYVYLSITYSLFILALAILVQVGDKKIIYISLASGFAFKFLFNKSFFNSFHVLAINASVAPVFVSLIAYFISSITAFLFIKYKFKIKYEESLRAFVDIMVSVSISILLLYLIRIKVPIDTSPTESIRIIILYSLIYFVSYQLIARKMKLKRYFKDETEKHKK